MFKKFVRIMATDVNEIIQRLEQLDLSPSETLVLLTEYTYEGMKAMGSGVKEVLENPFTHQPYTAPITQFALFTIYEFGIMPVTLMDKTHWYAMQSFKPVQSPEKVYSATKSENLVLIELNDSISQVLTMDMD